MDNSLTKENIISSGNIVVIILLILIFFKYYLPNYTTYVYSAISVIIFIISGLIISLPGGYTYKILYILLLLIPISFLNYTQIRYNKIIQKESKHLKLYNTLIHMSTFLLIFQMLLFNNSYNKKNMTHFYGSIILSLISTFFSGLIWRDVSFFITDG
jgi:predicted membrane protein